MGDLAGLHKMILTCYGSGDIFGQVNRGSGYICCRGSLVRRDGIDVRVYV